MSALSSPFFSFFLPFLFFHGRTTPFTPRSGLVGLVHLSFDDHGSFRNLSIGFSPTQTSRVLSSALFRRVRVPPVLE